MTVSDLSERELIARIERQLPPRPSWLVVGIGDDAAVAEPARNRLEVLTADSLVEGIHFDRAFVPSDAIGHRALAVNLSDLAAMGAEPRLAVLSLVLQPALPLSDFDEIIRGLAALAERHRIHVVGGNLSQSPGPLVIDVTAVGSIKRRRALTRAGAKPGDDLYVTGTVGSAAVGLELLRRGTAVSTGSDISRLTDAYLRPTPRIRIGSLLARQRAASACADLSDGLADAVRVIAEASQVGAALDGDALPIDPCAREWLGAQAKDPLLTALTGGDDYELLVGVPPRLRRAALAAARQAGVPFTRIGSCTAEPVLTVSRDRGERVEALPKGYGHFR